MTEYLGVVTAQGVLGVNVFKDVGAGVRNIFGGRSKSYENELASGVSDALAELETQAAHLGADAVVGVDIDYETVGDKMLMVSASGHGGEAELTAPRVDAVMSGFAGIPRGYAQGHRSRSGSSPNPWAVSLR